MKRRISRRFRPTMTSGLVELESRQLLSSGFQVVTSPTVSGAGLEAVSAVSPTDIWAVGSQSSDPLIENFNGTTWSVVSSPTVKGGSLGGVSAASSNAVWAVGSNGSGSPLVEFFNGTSWSVQTLPAQTGVFEAVAAISADDVWAVGQSGSGGDLIENFNGTSWSVVAAPGFSGGSNLTGISAISSTDIFASGTQGKKAGPDVLQFNGTAWTPLSTQPSGQEASTVVDAVSPTDVWVAGTKGLQNFNGTSWSVVSDPDANFSGISGTSASNIFAVGETPGDPPGGPETLTFVDQWNGTSWTQVTSANPSTTQDGLNGVTTLSNGTVVTVGDSFPGTFIESASIPVTPPANTIATTTALTSTTSSSPFGASVTFTATITPASTGSAAPTGSVAFMSGSTLLGGGTVSNDVAAFTTTALPVGTSSITAVYGGDVNYAASTSPAVSVTTTQATTTTAVFVSPASPVQGQSVTLTANITPASTGPVAPSGTVEFFSGSTLLGTGTVSSDTATLSTTALPVGSDAITATYEGDSNYVGSTSAADTVTVVAAATPASGAFSVTTSPTVTGSNLLGVSAVSPTDIWAVGSQTSGLLIENFNGTTWSVVSSPTVKGGSLSGVSALSSNAVWAVGSNGSGSPLVEFFNGTSWSVQTLPAQTGVFEAVAAVSADDVWAVGQSGSGGDLIENFNGTSWNVVAAPGFSGGSNLTGISAISSTDIFASGTQGRKRARMSCNSTARHGPRCRLSHPARRPRRSSTRSLPPTSGSPGPRASRTSTGRAGRSSPTRMPTSQASRAPRRTTSSPSAKRQGVSTGRSSISGTARTGPKSPARTRAPTRTPSTE